MEALSSFLRTTPTNRVTENDEISEEMHVLLCGGMVSGCILVERK